ncbi:Hypothetical protein R9X50_00589700 [Acrodontium crateriforme]|uniref:Uncharacterized protein n=1 Tax=Acrodontium crateriforme TaxID=150365 RepID=A0AAQ3MA72_9PEZI|nr:Hypothetical protein R9X50_00589700 [Acrodontium crateriforme]
MATDEPKFTQTTQNRFLALPPEIREQIYRIILHPSANRVTLPDEYTHYDFRQALTVLLINRQIHHEALKIFRELNCFVRIETPWPEAQTHVATQGHVPMVAVGEKASRFTNHSLCVRIDAPEVPMLSGDEQAFLVLSGDLDKFCQMWFYSNLSHPGLNPQLRLTLWLRDPFANSGEYEARMTEARQKELLFPFGRVKDLRSVLIAGELKPSPAIKDEMARLQAIPTPSAEHCLAEATRLKLEGNTALARNEYAATLEYYRQAWLAMHVVIKGRLRYIHADAFFGRELREAPYTGKLGQAERLILRVQLVANTCAVYLKMKEWEECVFWGMRTINMLREAMGADERQEISPEDEAVLGFPAADQMGKIYYRTAVAQKELDDKAEARRLLRVAAVYLPRDESVRKEIAACALRLG